MRFAKYEGLGNDFVVLDARGHQEPTTSVAFRQRLCDRHRGIGADGVITVLGPSTPDAVARMHITNADGSVPEMCGNGLRCVSLFLVHESVVAWDAPHTVETGAGLRRATAARHGPRNASDVGSPKAWVRVDMGPARFVVPGQIPTWRDEHIEVHGVSFRANAVSMGNPHLVLERASGEADIDLARSVGAILEMDPRFPERTNVEFVTLQKDGTVDVIVWERGVGLTEACGTGACGVAAVLARAGRIPTGVDVTVRLPGGPLSVHVPASEGGTVSMAGPARRVFDGDVLEHDILDDDVVGHVDAMSDAH